MGRRWVLWGDMGALWGDTGVPWGGIGSYGVIWGILGFCGAIRGFFMGVLWGDSGGYGSYGVLWWPYVVILGFYRVMLGSYGGARGSL